MRVFSRRGVDKDDRAKSIEEEEVAGLEKDYQDEIAMVEMERDQKLKNLLVGKSLVADLFDPTAKQTRLGKKGDRIERGQLENFSWNDLKKIKIKEDDGLPQTIRRIEELAEEQIALFDTMLEERIGHSFRDLGILEHALTHRSRAHEDASGGVMDNESLEFLGDAVLGFVIADMLFVRFPTHSEGYKSKVKAGIVSSASLARLAEEIDLGRFVLLGRGEEKTGGRQKQAILADSYEALIAAIYLDGGIDAARAFIVASFGPLFAAAGEHAADASFTADWKSALQEWLQAAGRGLPVYRLASAEGPDHRKRFEIEVMVGGEVISRAGGRAKKEAEQQAAREALAVLKGTADG